jgi:cold shock CspA family protein
MAEYFSKRDREKKKQHTRKEKDEKMRQRKEASRNGNSLADMMAYVDENGNLTSIPQDPKRKRDYSIDGIQIGVPKATDLNSNEVYEEGVVTFFNEEKGYGFIRDGRTKQSVFVHHKQLLVPIQINDKVRFLIAKGMKGPEATEVSIVQ